VPRLTGRKGEQPVQEELRELAVAGDPLVELEVGGGVGIADFLGLLASRGEGR
jgi:hypothetical protein